MVNIQVSVIISTYNQKDYLIEAINSVLFQSHQSINLIIIDDGSIKGEFNENLVSKFIDENKRDNLLSYRIIVNKQNFGTTKSLNIALQLVKDDYFMLLAGDDYLVQNAVAEMQTLMLEYDYDVIGCEKSLVDYPIHQCEERHFNSFDFYNNLSASEKVMFIINNGLPFSTGGAIYKTKSIIGIGGFNENFKLYEDRPLFINIALNMLRIGKSSLVCYLYRPGVGVTSSSNEANLTFQLDQIYLYETFYVSLYPRVPINKSEMLKVANKLKLKYELSLVNKSDKKVVSTLLFIFRNTVEIILLYKFELIPKVWKKITNLATTKSANQ
jgi:glycosyltransferase involved in cell wall biosynthesis